MRIKRLYLKILLSCLGILFVTILLILGLFILTAGQSYKSYLDKQTMAKLKIFKVMVQKEVDRHRELPAMANQDLVQLLNTCATLFALKVWITDPAGDILFQSFDGPVDFLASGVHRQIHHDGGITLYHYVLRWEKYYATIPIEYGINGLRLHMFVDTWTASRHEGLFFIGLIAIAAMATLLLIPTASFITRRVNRLNKSALEFAHGNLSVRTDIKGHDEIAKLGDSFNLMADRLERLVQNAKNLTANVSHELRSPLARIRVSKELIMDKLEHGCNPEGIRRYIDSMESDIQDLDTLIEHMLALSKMDYQVSAISPENFRFADFLESILAAYQPILDSNSLKLDLDIQDYGKVSQDKILVKSIFSNLMDNAIKYTQPGSTIRISAGTVSPKGLEFSVSNPCPPISQEDLDRLFDPFFRLAGQQAKGTGLGLTIAKRHILRCKGQIQARHTGKEICLTVYLP